MLVNFIGNNWYVVTSGYVENVECVILAKYGTARVRRIVYNDRRGEFVDLWFQVVQIDLPAEFRLEMWITEVNRVPPRKIFSYDVITYNSIIHYAYNFSKF